MKLRRSHWVLAASLMAVAIVAGLAASRWFDPESAVLVVGLAGIESPDVALASAPSTCDAGPEQLKQLDPELAAAFLAANAPGASRVDLTPLGDRFALANSRKLSALEEQGQTLWRAGSPERRVVRISRVGFRADHSEAAFCVRSDLASGLIHLRRQSGAWVDAGTISIAIR